MKGAFEKSLEFLGSVPEDVDKGVLSLEQGPATPLVAALDPLLVGRGGSYVSDTAVVPYAEMKELGV